MFVSLKVEVEAGKTVPVLTWKRGSLWWRALRGGPRVLWPCPSSAGPPLGVLEVEVGPAQPEAAAEVTEVTVFCELPLTTSPYHLYLLQEELKSFLCLFFCLAPSCHFIPETLLNSLKKEYSSFVWHKDLICISV